MDCRLFYSLGLLVFGLPALGQIMIIGHRGALGLHPENTLLSFEKAIEYGADMIELDVRLCSSGEIIIMHDESVDRTTDGSGRVADLTFDELKELDAGNGQKILTLSELFDSVDRRVKIDIELKEPIHDEVAELINYYIAQKGWHSDDFMVSSYCRGCLLKFHTLCPNVSVGFISNEQLAPESKFFNIPKSYAVISRQAIDEQYMLDLKQGQIPLIVYTVNDWQEIETRLNHDIAGIISDYPEHVKKIIELQS